MFSLGGNVQTVILEKRLVVVEQGSATRSHRGTISFLEEMVRGPEHDYKYFVDCRYNI